MQSCGYEAYHGEAQEPLHTTLFILRVKRKKEKGERKKEKGSYFKSDEKSHYFQEGPLGYWGPQVKTQAWREPQKAQKRVVI